MILGLGCAIADDLRSGGTSGLAPTSDGSGESGGDPSITTHPVTTSPSTTISATDGEDESDSSGGGESSGGTSSTGESFETTGGEDGLPDIDMLAVEELIGLSAYTGTRYFDADDCALAEACVDAGGDRRLLYFDTIAPNLGSGDFVVGSPDLDPAAFEFHACHGHWHWNDFAEYRLLDSDEVVVASGHKMSFMLMDVMQYDDGSADVGRFPLADGTQGVSAGWADIYWAGTDCNWIDITDVPAGGYTLEISVNFNADVAELDYSNNIARVPVTIEPGDGGGPIVPDEWTCNAAYYAGGVSDGCDCGCGAFDPDCTDGTSAACQFCNEVGSCAEGEVDCASIDANNNSICGPDDADPL